MILNKFILGAIAVGSLVIEPACAYPKLSTPTVSVAKHPTDSVPPDCFPAIGFTMPTAIPASLSNWWCNYDTEYAFVGFSYEITTCDEFFTGSMLSWCSPRSLFFFFFFQARVWPHWRKNFWILETDLEEDTCGSTVSAMTRDFSKLDLLKKKKRLLGLTAHT